METNQDSYALKCAFCGKINTYEREDLYVQEDGQQKISAKWCQQCGEPLVKYCPNCNTGIFINSNLKDTSFFKVDDKFNEPTPSKLDDLLPILKEQVKNYKEIAIRLNPDLFRTSQPKYLANIPKILDLTSNLRNTINDIKNYGSQNPHFQARTFIDDLLKGLDKSQKKCQDVQNSIVPDKEFVDEKMDKTLRKKNLKILSWEEPYNQFITKAEEYRQNEIRDELNSYKPGRERIEQYLLHDPTNYRLVCPTCKTKVYSIEKNDFVVGQKGKHYGEAINLADVMTDSAISQTSEFSNTSTFIVTIYISKPGGETFNINASMKFVLNEGEELVIGRNYIRDLNYNEPISEDLLFDPEEDILGMVSRTQFTLFKENNKLMVKGLDFDPRRIGTYVNSLDNDIRQNFPTGIEIKKKDKIIVPITSESQNENRIEMILQ